MLAFFLSLSLSLSNKLSLCSSLHSVLNFKDKYIFENTYTRFNEILLWWSDLLNAIILCWIVSGLNVTGTTSHCVNLTAVGSWKDVIFRADNGSTARKGL